MRILTGSSGAWVKKAYDAAAGYLNDDPLLSRERFGVRTIERLALSRGAIVLGVGCGAGISTISAAQRVGGRLGLRASV
jgi:hypothetical protein